MNRCTKGAAAFFLLSASAKALAPSDKNEMLVNAETGAISFPLIPHHVHRRRLGLSDEEVFAEELDEDQRRNRQRRRRTVENNSNEIMAGLYMGYGTHYVDLWCGSPPQRQTVIVDTGSSQTAFPCSDCQDCGSPKYHAGKLFDESKSSTFLSYDCENCSQRSVCNSKTDLCEIEQYYSEGSSWTAYEAMDSCYIGGYHSTAISNVRH
jgi:hypothetical protein